MTDTAAGRTGIEVTGSISIFLFLYFFLFKPAIVIDGTTHSGKWNSPTFTQTSPGQHQVEVFYKLYWVIPTNKVATSVTVPDGGVARLDYKPSFWGFLGKGKLTTSPA